jgi:hypothetical protein
MLALILIGAAVVLALVIVVAWLVHSVSKLKTEAAYVSELNKIIDHVNSLSHGDNRRTSGQQPGWSRRREWLPRGRLPK